MLIKAFACYSNSLVYWMLLFVFYFQYHLEPSIESCLKKCQDKKECHQIRNIDCIYMINLDQRPEKYARSLQELSPYGITPYRFSAVNGWELSLQQINTLGVKYHPNMTQKIWGTSYLLQNKGQPYHEVIQNKGRVYFCHTMARGPIGIVLSHLSILEDAYNSGFNTVWIMEDDIEVIQNPHLISDRIEELDALIGAKEWDVLFTDRDTKNQKGEYIPCYGYALRPNFTPSYPERFAIREDVNSCFRKVGARYGAYSYIVRRSGMEKILNFIKRYKIFLPYDMDFCLPDDIRLYCVKEDIVSTHPNALSDNGAPNYKLTPTQEETSQSVLNDSMNNQVVKHKALEVMNQLEGWCSQEKAAFLIDLIYQNHPQVVVEIGVFGGKSLLPMAYGLQANKVGTIYGIDPWDSAASSEGMEGPNLTYWSGIDHNQILSGLSNKIKECDLESYVKLIRSTSEAAPLIDNIDLLHIDGNHSEKTSYLDVTKWVPQVKPGGLILFDDVTWGTTDKAVAWLDEHCIRIAEFQDTSVWGLWLKE